MSQKSILIVEDSQYLAESLFDMFTLKGHLAQIAPSGREAIELALNTKPDLILLDIRLPDIDGYEVYRRLRKDDWGAKVKIIILTASESIENIAKNIDLPRDYILFKPDWSVSDLLEKIEEHLNL